MENNALTEKGLLATLNAALAIHAHAEIMHLFTELACLYIGKGLTQEGADLIAPYDIPPPPAPPTTATSPRAAVKPTSRAKPPSRKRDGGQGSLF